MDTSRCLGLRRQAYARPRYAEHLMTWQHTPGRAAHFGGTASRPRDENQVKTVFLQRCQRASADRTTEAMQWYPLQRLPTGTGHSVSDNKLMVPAITAT